jgi:hypothetical protein
VVWSDGLVSRDADQGAIFNGMAWVVEPRHRQGARLIWLKYSLNQRLLEESIVTAAKDLHRSSQLLIKYGSDGDEAFKADTAGR